MIGLSVAWELATSGLGVTVVDPAPGSGASGVAAGMLAAVTEAHFTEPDLAGANVLSLSLWPGYASRLEAASGMVVGLERAGTLVVAGDPSDRDALAQLGRFVNSIGLEAEWVGARELRRREPLLSPNLTGALFAPGDYSVNNRSLHAALLAACKTAGVDFVQEAASGVATSDATAIGVTISGGELIAAEWVVVAAGAWTAGISGLPLSLTSALRPIKGHILRLSPTERAGPLPLLSHTVRGLVNGRPVYLVPRADRELVLGATSEERGFDLRKEAGSVGDLLQDARAVLPAIDHCELTEIGVGLRPGSFDNAPVVGRVGPRGLVAACGHYRNGILLAPLTAELVADEILGNSRHSIPSFLPSRLVERKNPALQEGGLG